MYKSDCPTWICNEWGVPYDGYYFLAFLVLLIPYGVLWLKLVKKSRHWLNSALSYSVLVLLTEITLILYYVMLAMIGISANWHFLGALGLGVYMWLIYALLPILAITALLSMVSLFKKPEGS